MPEISAEEQEILDRLARGNVLNVMKKRKFDFFSYDLRQNLAFYGSLPKLKQHALIFATGYCFKKSDFNEIKALNFENKEILSDEYINNIIDALVRRFIHEISDRFNYRLRLPFLTAKSTIRLVLTQIISFVQTNKTYLLEERDLFLKNIVLTRDGTVNTKKTVYEVLKENLTPYRKFKLAATFFLNKEQVSHYYSELSTEEKKSFSLKKMEEDFAGYYWTWKFNKTRNPIKNDFVAYAYDDPSKTKVKRCDKDILKNDELTYQAIFKHAVDEHNEMAVQYLWKAHLKTLTQREYILNDRLNSLLGNYKTFTFTHTNIIIYLLLQVFEDEIPRFFSEESPTIQMVIYNNPRWFDIYFKVLQVLEDDIQDGEYFYMLYNISASYRNRNSREIDLDFFSEFIFLMPEEQEILLKDFRYLRPMYYDLLRVPFERSDANLINALLEFCSEDMIGPFFLSYQGGELIEICIRNSEYRIINDVLSILPENVMKQIIMSVFKAAAYDICSDLLFFDVHEIKTFLEWTSELFKEKKKEGGDPKTKRESEKEKQNLQQKDFIKVFLNKEFVYKHNGRNIKNLIFARKDDPFFRPLSYTEESLLTLMSKDDVNKIKSSISLHFSDNEWIHASKALLYRYKWKYAKGLKITFYDKIIVLVLQSDWNFLNEIIIWKNSTRQEKENLGRKLLTDSSLFEKMNNKDCINYLYEFVNFVRNYLLIHWKHEYLFKKFKLKVFDHKSFLKPLIKDFKLGELKEAIEWYDLPVKRRRGLKKDILHDLQIYRPTSKEAEKQYKNFSNWIDSMCK